MITNIYTSIEPSYSHVKNRTRPSKPLKEQLNEAKRTEGKLDAVKNLQIGQQQAAAQEFQSTVYRSLDETEKNVRKSIDETRNQIPQYTNVVKNYQEQAAPSVLVHI
jgi:hypothetical protein